MARYGLFTCSNCLHLDTVLYISAHSCRTSPILCFACDPAGVRVTVGAISRVSGFARSNHWYAPALTKRYIRVDRMSEIIPYIQRCQKYLLHCPAYSLRNDIHLWLLSGAHLWVSPPLTTHQSQFEIFIFHTFRLPPVSTKANHPSGQDSQLQHPSMYTSTEPFYKAYAILIHKAMVLTAIVPLPSHEPGQLLERLRCFKTQRRSLFQRRPFKKSPFQVAEKKKNATSSKQIQGTWCFGLNGHRRDPYVDDSVPEQCRLDVDLL